MLCVNRALYSRLNYPTGTGYFIANRPSVFYIERELYNPI